MKLTGVAVRPIFRPTTILLGYLDLGFDIMVVRGFRLLDNRGVMALKMPSRQRTLSCRVCHEEHAVEARFCPACGHQLPQAKVDPCYLPSVMFREPSLLDDSHTVARMALALALAMPDHPRPKREGGWYEFGIVWPSGESGGQVAPILQTLPDGSKI